MLSNEGFSASEEQKGLNRNSLEEEEEHSEDSEDLWDDQDKEDDAISAEFEAFSDTDSETPQEADEEADKSDEAEDEAELLDQFDENISFNRHRRHSTPSDDILQAVQAVKLNYSFPFQDSRQVQKYLLGPYSVGQFCCLCWVGQSVLFLALTMRTELRPHVVSACSAVQSAVFCCYIIAAF